MKNGYQMLNLLTSKLNENMELTSKIASTDKESFVNNDKLITISIGLLNEIGEIISAIDENIFVLSKRMYDILFPIKNYSTSITNKYGFVNAYKLYDVIKIDITELRNILNEINKKDS